MSASYRTHGGGYTSVQTAAAYAARGVAVLPLWWPTDNGCACPDGDLCETNKRGKHPVSVGAHDASTDPMIVLSWWDAWPEANIGMVPPPETVVLDVDPRNGGASNLLARTRAHEPLNPTLAAATGGGGLHAWYRRPGAGKVVTIPGVDVISGPGRYVVAPPSRHTSGERYAWITDHQVAELPG